MMSWCSLSLLLLCSHWTFTEVNMWILVRLFMVNFVQLAQLRTNWCIILRTIKSTSFLSKQIRRELFPYKFRIYIWWGQQKKIKEVLLWSHLILLRNSSEDIIMTIEKMEGRENEVIWSSGFCITLQATEKLQVCIQLVFFVRLSRWVTFAA